MLFIAALHDAIEEYTLGIPVVDSIALSFCSTFSYQLAVKYSTYFVENCCSYISDSNNDGFSFCRQLNTHGIKHVQFPNSSKTM